MEAAGAMGKKLDDQTNALNSAETVPSAAAETATATSSADATPTVTELAAASIVIKRVPPLNLRTDTTQIEPITMSADSLSQRSEYSEDRGDETGRSYADEEEDEEGDDDQDYDDNDNFDEEDAADPDDNENDDNLEQQVAEFSAEDDSIKKGKEKMRADESLQDQRQSPPRITIADVSPAAASERAKTPPLEGRRSPPRGNLFPSQGGAMPPRSPRTPARRVKKVTIEETPKNKSLALKFLFELIKKENVFFTLLRYFLTNQEIKKPSSVVTKIIEEETRPRSNSGTRIPFAKLFTPRATEDTPDTKVDSDASNIMACGWERLKQYLADQGKSLDPLLINYRKIVQANNFMEIIGEVTPERFYENINDLYTLICDERMPFQKTLFPHMTAASVCYDQDQEKIAQAQRELTKIKDSNKNTLFSFNEEDRIFIVKHHLNAFAERDAENERIQKLKEISQHSFVDDGIKLTLQQTQQLIELSKTIENNVRNVTERNGQYKPVMCALAENARLLLESAAKKLNKLLSYLKANDALENESIFDLLEFKITADLPFNQLIAKLAAFIKLIRNKIEVLAALQNDSTKSQLTEDIRGVMRDLLVQRKEDIAAIVGITGIADLLVEEAEAVERIANIPDDPAAYLGDCLIKPVQRMPQYPMTTEEVLKATIKELNDYAKKELVDELQQIKLLIEESKSIADRIQSKDERQKEFSRIMYEFAGVAKKLLEKRTAKTNLLLAQLKSLPILHSETCLEPITLSINSDISLDELKVKLRQLTEIINKKIDEVECIGKDYIKNLIADDIKQLVAGFKVRDSEKFARKLVEILAQGINQSLNELFNGELATSVVVNQDLLRTFITQAINKALEDQNTQNLFKLQIIERLESFQQQITQLNFHKLFENSNLSHLQQLNDVLKTHKAEIVEIKDIGILSNLTQIFAVYKHFVYKTNNDPYKQTPIRRRHASTYTAAQTTPRVVPPEIIEYFVRTLCLIDHCLDTVLASNLKNNLNALENAKSVQAQIKLEIAQTENYLRDLVKNVVNLLLSRKEGEGLSKEELHKQIKVTIKKINSPSSIIVKLLNALVTLNDNQYRQLDILNNQEDHCLNYVQHLLPKDLFHSAKSGSHPDQDLEQHYTARHILATVAHFFYEFDCRVARESIKSAGEVEQDASYEIQKALNYLFQLPIKKIAKKLRNKGQTLSIRDLIIKEISKRLVVAGKISDCYLQGPFGETLNQVVKYLDNLIVREQRAKSVTRMFIPNPLRKRATVANQNKEPQKLSRNVLIAAMMSFTDYYLNTPLGQKVVENVTADGDEPIYNNNFRGRYYVEQLRSHAVKMYLDNRSDAIVMTEALGVIKQLSNQIENRTLHCLAGEMNILINHLATALDPKNPQLIKTSSNVSDRFPENIVQYDMKEEDAIKYIRLHIVQQHALRFNYKDKVNKRHIKQTSEHKKLTMELIERLLEGLYNGEQSKIDAEINKLHEGQRTLPDLIAKDLHTYIEPPFARNSVLAQGEFRTAFSALNDFPKGKSEQRKRNSVGSSGARVAQVKENISDPTGRSSVERAVPVTPFKMTELPLLQFIAQLLYLTDYYCDNELACEMLENLNANKEENEKVVPNDSKQGQKKYAQDLAEFVVRIYLENPNALATADGQAAIKSQIKEKMREIVNRISSTRSRFANTLDTLLNPERTHRRHLPADIVSERFNKEDNMAENYIHRHMIEQVKIPLREFDEAMMKKWLKPAAKLEQNASFNLRFNLTELSNMGLLERRNKIRGSGNLRNYLINRVGDHIVRSGRISACFRAGLFGDALLKIQNYFNNVRPKQAGQNSDNVVQNSESKAQNFTTMFVKNQVVGYSRETEQVNDLEMQNTERRKLELISSMMVIADYYCNTFLGQQYVDDYNSTHEAGTHSELQLLYNDKKNSWVKQARTLAQIAAKFYLDKRNNEEVINDAIGQLKTLIKEIRGHGIIGDSRLANELISLIMNFTGVAEVEIDGNRIILSRDNNRFTPNKVNIFNPKLGAAKAENYIQMHIIQTATEMLEPYETEISGRSHKRTAKCKVDVLERTRNNYDVFYRESLENRKKLIRANSGDMTHYIFSEMRKEIPQHESIKSHHSMFSKGKFSELLDHLLDYISFIRPKAQSPEAPASRKTTVAASDQTLITTQAGARGLGFDKQAGGSPSKAKK